MKGKIIELGLELAEQIASPHGTPAEEQLKSLKWLIKKGRRTFFGRFYHFDQLAREANPLAAFRHTVPIFDYDQLFENWWHRSLSGEKHITWPGKVKYFALSSGTSGATSKRLPLSRAMFRHLKKGAFRLFAHLPSFDIPPDTFTKTWLAIGGTSHLAKVDGHYEGYLSGINARKRPLWARGYYKPGKKIAEISDFEKRTHLIADEAPAWDIGILVGIPHWIQLTLEEIIDKHQLSTINEIWPNLAMLVSGGVDYRPYMVNFERLIGQPIQYVNTYLASEGFIAFQEDKQHLDLTLQPDLGIFYEFIPFQPDYFDDDGNLLQQDVPIFWLGDAQDNIDYAVVLSTCAGAWRYLLGDTIRFTNVSEGRFVISGRTKYYLNLCTEHLTGDNTNAAIHKTEEMLDVSIPEYTIAGIQQGDRFCHHWYIGTDDIIDSELLRKTLDMNLRTLNDDYDSERKTVLDISLEILPVNTFYGWQKSRKQYNAQSKIPRVIKGQMLEDWQAFLTKRH